VIKLAQLKSSMAVSPDAMLHISLLLDSQQLAMVHLVALASQSSHVITARADACCLVEPLTVGGS